MKKAGGAAGETQPMAGMGDPRAVAKQQIHAETIAHERKHL
jgi:hypothetical protein